jgi:hypothetical protein
MLRYQEKEEPTIFEDDFRRKKREELWVRLLLTRNVKGIAHQMFNVLLFICYPKVYFQKIPSITIS